tara:strand:- start:2331 stop:4418 length:2088 start_codon:yes stop_codon:yes gene_type:complete
MSIICPLTNTEITDAVISPDGFTYERSALLKYIRKYKKSPITGEYIDGTTLVYDSNYDNSLEKIGNDYIDYVRKELEDYISLKKQHNNFEKVPDEIKLYLTKSQNNTWECLCEDKYCPENKLSDKIQNYIHHMISAMFFKISGDNNIYTTKNIGNGKLKVFGSNNINEIYNINSEVIITKWSSYTKEFSVKKWLDNTDAEDLVSKPFRVLLGLDDNQTIFNNLNITYSDPNIYTQHLNNEQKKVFEEQYMTSLQIIEGPPGTGKTTVINSLVNYLSNITNNHYIIIISEKNKGVDAVAEKIGNTNDNVISFGSENIGKSTESFLMDNKINKNSNVLNAYNEIDVLKKSVEQKFRKLKRLIYTLLPRKIHKNLTLSNLGFIQYKINNISKDNNKKQKVLTVLDEINTLNKDIYEKEQNISKIKQSVEEDYTKKCNIILSTFGSLHQVISFLKDNDNISVSIIVDESSTMLLWQGFYLQHFVNDIHGHLVNIIMFGDSKQLPPYWPDNDKPNQEKNSFLDFSKQKCKYIQFQKQYRMPNQIMKILNKEFYKEKPLIMGSYRDDIKESIAWIHSDGTNDEKNEKEAYMILKLLYMISIESTVLIITPYKNQTEILEKMVESFLNVSVMTLDSVQGHEADFVIVSLVKSVPTSFLTQKRTCVLISRAKTQLIVFGNRQECLKNTNSCIRKLARYKGINF